MSVSVATGSSKHKRELNCALCNSPFLEPKLLPCLHTFCLQCLTKYCSTKKPKCPTCSEKFSLSVGGFKQLPTNEFAKRLAELQETLDEHTTGTSCNTCTETNTTRGTKRKVMATVYCLDCEQNLCPGCEKIHKRLKTTSLHTKIEIDELRNSSRSLEKLAKSKVQLCAQHPQERISLFCCNCKCTICTVCYVTQHKTHDSEDIAPVAQKIRNQLKQSIEELKTWNKNYILDMKDLSAEIQRYKNNVADVMNTIKENAEAAKDLIDEMANELLGDLDKAKYKNLDAERSYESYHDSKLTSVQDCLEFVQNVLTNGSDEDVIGLSGSIDRRLKQTLERRPDVITLDQLSFALSPTIPLNQPPRQPKQEYRIYRSPATECVAQNSLGTIYNSAQAVPSVWSGR